MNPQPPLPFPKGCGRPNLARWRIRGGRKMTGTHEMGGPCSKSRNTSHDVCRGSFSLFDKGGKTHDRDERGDGERQRQQEWQRGRGRSDKERRNGKDEEGRKASEEDGGRPNGPTATPQVNRHHRQRINKTAGESTRQRANRQDSERIDETAGKSTTQRANGGRINKTAGHHG